MLKDLHRYVLPLFSASMALALAIIVWTTLGAVRTAGKVLGEESTVNRSQKEQLDRLTNQMEGR